MKTEMEQALSAAMDAEIDESQVDDVESDLLAAADGVPSEEIQEPEAKADEEKEPEAKADDEKEPEAKADDEKEPEAKADEPDVKTEKAPAGWTPANREHWAGLPDGLKQQINKREREVNDVLQNSAQDRKLAQAFTQTAQPYQSLMAAEGAANPLVAFKGLLDTASTLKMGSASQKAQKISDLIGHYGVDISALDSILSGQAPTPSGNSEVEQIIADRLKPLESVINDYKTREQNQIQQTNTKTQTDIATFGAANEFFEDVRNTMADAMDMATKEGRVMSMQEAYDFACNMTPEIKTVLATRADQNNIQKKKEAAASLNHKRGGQGGRDQPQGLEATIADLWDGVPS